MTFQGTSAARRLVPAAMFLTLLCSCATIRYPLPAEDLRITDPNVLIGRLESRRARISTVSTTGRISAKLSGMPMSGRLTTLVSAAGLVRLDAWTPTWDLVGSFTGDPETFLYLSRFEGFCKTGTSSRTAISRVLPIGLDYPSLARILLGSAPLPAGVDFRIAWDTRTGLWLLSGRTTQGHLVRIWAEGDGVARRVVMNGPDGNADVRFEDIIQVDGERFPTNIVIEMDSYRTSLVFKEISVNGMTGSDDFQQICPEGFPIISVE